MSGQRRSVPPAGSGVERSSGSRPNRAEDDFDKPADGDLIARPDMIDVPVRALIDQKHKPVDEIIYMHKGARLTSITLNLEGHRPGRMFFDLLAGAKHELRDNVLPTHIRAVDVMGPKLIAFSNRSR